MSTYTESDREDVLLEARTLGVKNAYIKFQSDLHDIVTEKVVQTYDELIDAQDANDTSNWPWYYDEHTQKTVDNLEAEKIQIKAEVSELADKVSQRMLDEKDSLQQALGRATTDQEVNAELIKFEQQLKNISNYVDANVNTEFRFKFKYGANALIDSAFQSMNPPAPVQENEARANVNGNAPNASNGIGNTAVPDPATTTSLPNPQTFNTIDEAMQAVQARINVMPTTGGADEAANKALISAKAAAVQAFDKFYRTQKAYENDLDRRLKGVLANDDISQEDKVVSQDIVNNANNTAIAIIERELAVADADKSFGASTVKAIAGGSGVSSYIFTGGVIGVYENAIAPKKGKALNPKPDLPTPTIYESLSNMSSQGVADGENWALGRLGQAGSMLWGAGKSALSSAWENKDGWGGIAAGVIGTVLAARYVLYPFLNATIGAIPMLGGIGTFAGVLIGGAMVYGAISGYMQGGGSNAPDNLMALKTQATADDELNVRVSKIGSANELLANNTGIFPEAMKDAIASVANDDAQVELSGRRAGIDNLAVRDFEFSPNGGVA